MHYCASFQGPIDCVIGRTVVVHMDCAGGKRRLEAGYDITDGVTLVQARNEYCYGLVGRFGADAGLAWSVELTNPFWSCGQSKSAAAPPEPGQLGVCFYGYLAGGATMDVVVINHRRSGRPRPDIDTVDIGWNINEGRQVPICIGFRI